jgi:hypothetical protein
MSPEMEKLLVNSKHKQAFEVMITMEHAGPDVQKKIESTIPLKTSLKDLTYSDRGDFYTRHPASPKVIDYFLSLAVDDEGKCYTALLVFKAQKLSDESKQKLKAALPSVKNDTFRKTLETLTK